MLQLRMSLQRSLREFFGKDVRPPRLEQATIGFLPRTDVEKRHREEEHEKALLTREPEKRQKQEEAQFHHNFEGLGSGRFAGCLGS